MGLFKFIHMTRKESIIYDFGFAIIVALAFIIGIMMAPIPKQTEIETQLPEREGIVIDGHNIEVVYDDYGATYLKYVIQGSVMYVPIPPETELPDSTDSLKFYYTKKVNNERRL
jgi:hypothetical protein